MGKIEGYNSRIERLSELVGLLEKGELSLDDLSEMESITRELHERSIIIRYHAFKDQVMPEAATAEDEDNDSEIDEDGGVEVEVVIEELDLEYEEVEKEEQAFDFAIFDTDEKEEQVEEPIVEEPEAVIEEVVVEEPEPVVEEIVVEEPIIEEPVAIVEEVKAPEPEPEPVVEPTPPPVHEHHAAETPKSFLDRLVIEDNSLASRFSASKLNSLIGAFGLNERLRYINDLFDGSSEIFSDAIKSLDSQPSLDEAKLKAAELAVDHEWDPEEEVVIEFMSYLNRRYA